MSSRRDFLKSLFYSGAYYKLVRPIQLIVNGVVTQQIFANENNYGPKYIRFLFAGAPPRWFYDCPLRIHDNSVFQNNSMSITHGSGEYRDYKYKNKYNIPILWQRDMPLVNSSKIKQESLLDNMIFIRGISAPNPDHLSSRLATISPNNEVETIAGILMENASEIIPAVQYDQVFHHKSKIGQGAIITGGEGTNFASTLLSSFNSSRVFEKFMTNDNLEKMINAAASSISSQNIFQDGKREIIKLDKKKAKEAIRTGISQYIEQYDTLFAKYDSLMKASFNTSLGEGIELGNHLSNQNYDRKFYQLQGNINFFDDKQIDNLMDGFNEDTYILRLRESFAIAELLIKNNISNSFLGRVLHIGNINYGSGNVTISLDGHSTGKYSSLLFYSKFYQAFNTCLYELMSQLKSDNMFDRTLIEITSEFNRMGRRDGSGSDHGWKGANTTLLSGKIKEFQISGYTAPYQSGTYEGSWGYAGDMNGKVSGGKITMDNLISTCANILGIRSPLVNVDSLVTENSRGEMHIRFEGKDVS